MHAPSINVHFVEIFAWARSGLGAASDVSRHWDRTESMVVPTHCFRSGVPQDTVPLRTEGARRRCRKNLLARSPGSAPRLFGPSPVVSLISWSLVPA